MAPETGTYINSLNASNPVSTLDPIQPPMTTSGSRTDYQGDVPHHRRRRCDTHRNQHRPMATPQPPPRHSCDRRNRRQ